MEIRIGRGIAAGIIGTLAMTAVGLWVGPLVGIPAMNPAWMLADTMGGSIVLGWAGHLMIGTVLALLYAATAARLPGPPVVRGALFALAPYVMAQVIVAPIMGMPLFLGSALLATGSLIGHLVFGAVMGAVYGPAPSGATADLRAAPAR